MSFSASIYEDTSLPNGLRRVRYAFTHSVHPAVVLSAPKQVDEAFNAQADADAMASVLEGELVADEKELLFQLMVDLGAIYGTLTPLWTSQEELDAYLARRLLNATVDLDYDIVLRLRSFREAHSTADFRRWLGTAQNVTNSFLGNIDDIFLSRDQLADHGIPRDPSVDP